MKNITISFFRQQLSLAGIGSFKVALIVLFLPSFSIFAQTVIIGSGTTTAGAVIGIHQTGTTKSSKSVHVVRKEQLIAQGITTGATITEWGYKKTSTSTIVGNASWMLKVYLKNGSYLNTNNAAFGSIKDGATLFYQSVVDKNNLPVQNSYWMWQMQNYFEYTGNDLICIVEWTPINTNSFNNITNLFSWEMSDANTGTHVGIETYIEGVTDIPDTRRIPLGRGCNTRISFLKANLFNATPVAGTINASVSMANSGAPFTLLSNNISYGFDMVYQWQKSPAGLNQWQNLGENLLFPSRSTVMQDSPSDYRMISTCSTNGQSAVSNVVSVGQNSNVIFGDDSFKAAILRSNLITRTATNFADQYYNPDVNDDGEIQLSEALLVKGFGFNYTSSTSIVGLEKFSNLKSFFLSSNSMPNMMLPELPNLEILSIVFSNLENIILPALPNLKMVIFSNNKLTSVNLENMPMLQFINLDDNLFESYTAPQLTTLFGLNIENNKLTSLTVENTPSLINLNFNNNLMTSFSFASEGNTNGLDINCKNNLLTSLNVNNLTRLHKLDCSHNRLETLNLSGTSPDIFYCNDNNLTSLNIQNGYDEYDFNFSNNPNLTHICADYNDIVAIENLALSYGLTGLNVNDYCTFEPSTDLRIIQGKSSFSEDLASCTTSLINYPSLKLKWIENSEPDLYFLENLYTNSRGEFKEQLSYYYPFILRPELENPEYFNVSPEIFHFNFLENPGPITQNFCVTPNGIHHDIEAVFFPLTDARPGFDASYRILIKNKGTEVSAGQITLQYEDQAIDLITSSVVPVSNSNNRLVWNYDNLNPFETKSIVLSFNLNRPTDTPPLNNGDVLDFFLNVATLNADEYPLNNSFLVNQKMVNSFDPNDKTCLEGNTISPEKIGEYVHYLIRFENTGTADAINVVVKDIIDTNYFDINSLVAMQASHSYKIRQKENTFEFIFENINLPFDNANNDGFILFKIKLKNNLVVGNSFSNKAQIYFDYNYPIITNTETTTIEVLSRSDFRKDNSVKIYPNPANDFVNIKASSNINSIEMYDVQGRILITNLYNETEATLDLTRHSAGIYYLKIKTDEGSKVERVIKK